jgi:hypothetical protein
VTCTATTRDGAPCRRPALRGGEVCHGHSGARVGRPPALTPEVHERIVQAKQLGCPDRVAAQLAGISETTYYELVRKGRTHESGPEHELVEAVGRAEAQAYIRAMASWNKGASTDWRAGKALVEHHDRKHAPAPLRSDAEDRIAGRRLDTTELTEAQLEYLAGLLDGEDAAAEQ